MTDRETDREAGGQTDTDRMSGKPDGESTRKVLESPVPPSGMRASAGGRDRPRNWPVIPGHLLLISGEKNMGR